MRRSKRNDSRLSRFVYYRWSGPIVFVPLIILSVSIFVYADSNQEFFTAWSCDTVRSYLLNDGVPDEFPLHNDLSEEQHLKLHGILDECNSAAKFSEKISHDVMTDNTDTFDEFILLDDCIKNGKHARYEGLDLDRYLDPNYEELNYRDQQIRDCMNE